jgi:roadblock/LC7 domain-containing protein
MCGENESKKPRLFYLDEAENMWVPVKDNEIEGIIALDQFSNDGEVIELQFKRFDMTDKEFENMSEA